MTCRDCESSKTRRWHGGYDLACLPCCARLVLSARPSREHARGMLAAIERWLLQQSPPPFSIADVSAKAREMREQLDESRQRMSESVASNAMAEMRSALSKGGC